MTFHSLDLAALLKQLNSTPAGLTAAEAERRLAEFGPNEVRRAPRERPALRLLKAFANFFAIVLWIAAILSFIAEHAQPGQGMATLGGAIIGVIIINGAFSFWQESKAEHALAELEKLLPQSVTVVRDGVEHAIDRRRLVPGDVLAIEEGNEVPADARVIEAHGLRVSEAAMTGESAPRDRDALPSAAADAAQAANILLAGTSVVTGRGRAVVFATGMHTEFGKIAHLTHTAGESLSPLQGEIVRLSRVLVALASALGVVFFLVGRALRLPFWDNFLFAIGIIVANVPEGLLPTVTLALAMASQRMAKRNVLIRHLPSVEALGSATVICTDKTGTLTENRMAVVRVFAGGRSMDAGALRAAEPGGALLTGMLACHDLKEVEDGGGRRLLGDPMEIALVEAARRALGEAPAPRRVDEVPFDAERKRLAVLIEAAPAGEAGAGEGRRALHVKGAIETVLALCTRIQDGSGVRPITAEDARRAALEQEAMAKGGLRVLCFAHREVDPAMTGDPAGMERELVLDGLVALRDPPRPEVAGAVARCRSAGIRVIMITGDHPTTAAAIAREIGIIDSEEAVVITGERLKRMSDTQLQIALDAPDLVFARTRPDQKMRIVQALQRKKHVVAVTGDGVNDAPALKCADVGIAMGRGGTDVARSAADMVLADDNFASIVAGIEEGRAVFVNIRKFMTYILTSNVPEIVPYLAFVLFKIPLPLTIIQILAVDLGTDMLPALALGVEPPDPRLMERPPRRRGERLLDGRLLLRAYGFLGVLESVAALAAFFYVLRSGGAQIGTGEIEPRLYREATTACLTAIVLSQIVNLFICRSDVDSAFSRGLGRNRWLLWGLAVEISILLFIDYTPWGNALFGTAPLRAGAWVFASPFVLGMLLLEEGRKALARGRGGGQSAAAGR